MKREFFTTKHPACPTPGPYPVPDNWHNFSTNVYIYSSHKCTTLKIQK